ncbi:MAG: serine--tRNA ligase, partial [Actinomycetota bacterium]|nr:serine--tRNA ligase [Actinomycetota bacterium]
MRRDPEAARTALARRGEGVAETLDDLLSLDAARRELLPRLEELRAEQNRASERIAQAKRAGEDAGDAIAEMRGVAARAKELQGEVAAVDERLGAALAVVPNLPADSAAECEEEVLREVGHAGAEGRDHLELLDGLVDMEAGSRVSGSRFAYLRGPLVLLELALVRFAIERLGAHGFEPVIPPVL